MKILSCSICGQLLGPDNIYRCSECGRIVCREHIMYDPKTSKKKCIRCNTTHTHRKEDVLKEIAMIYFQ